MTVLVRYLVVKAVEIPARVTKATTRTPGFQERWTKLGIKIGSIHTGLPED
jgi:hypothetical protein